MVLRAAPCPLSASYRLKSTESSRLRDYPFECDAERLFLFHDGRHGTPVVAKLSLVPYLKRP